jgi:phosphoribosylformylglycinamidine synthase
MARDGAGIDVHLDRVPLREPDLEPWEIVISESQERMVAIVRPEMLEAAERVLDRWELHHATIGEVTPTGELRCFADGDIVGSIPARLLTEETPRYRVEPRPRLRPEPPVMVSLSLLERLRSPNLASKRWVYEQYDHLVGSRTVRRPGLDAAVLRLRPGMRGVAVSLDGPGAGAGLDPRAAGALAVLEAARNVACAGGEPLALTDCLNFGNPEKPEIAWELEEAVGGLAAAAEALGIPFVSGNVSLYNETEGRAIDPTPVVGCVGLVRDVRRIPSRWREGDVVLLAGSPELSLAGLSYEALDLRAEAALVRFLWRAAPLLTLAHDTGRGGLAVALAEAALWSGVGADLDLPDDELALFGEGGGQAVLACAPEDVDRLGSKGLRRLGIVGGESICGVELEELREAHG